MIESYIEIGVDDNRADNEMLAQVMAAPNEHQALLVFHRWMAAMFCDSDAQAERLARHMVNERRRGREPALVGGRTDAMLQARADVRSGRRPMPVVPRVMGVTPEAAEYMEGPE